MKRPGVVPPGKAGLVVLAFALIPLAVEKFRPAVRWMGRRLVDLGETVERIAKEEPVRKESKVEEKVEPQDEHAPTPPRSTASPHSQVEMEAQKTKPKKAAGGSATVGEKRSRVKMSGATPPTNNPKRARKKAEGSDSGQVRENQEP